MKKLISTAGSAGIQTQEHKYYQIKHSQGYYILHNETLGLVIGSKDVPWGGVPFAEQWIIDMCKEELTEYQEKMYKEAGFQKAVEDTIKKYKFALDNLADR